MLALARGGDAAVGLSPLVVHGPSGVGKSRLLAGLVAECLLRRPESAVAHLEAEAFAAACAEAAGQAGGWADLRERFRRLDLFVLEDLHALERAPLALTELVHTLDALDEAGARRGGLGSFRTGPVVGGGLAAAAGQPPGRGPGRPGRSAGACLPPPVRARACPGVRVGPVGRCGRGAGRIRPTATGRSTAGSPGSPWPVASDSTAGRWSRASSRLCSRRSDRGRRRPGHHRAGRPRRCRALPRPARRPPRATRRQTIVAPRHLAIYLARTVTGQSYQAIGAYFGRRDPATVRHACRAAAARLAADPPSPPWPAALAPPLAADRAGR